jgi:hypothetical protein
MPSVVVIAPLVFPLLGAAAITALGLAGIDIGRALASVAVLASLISLLVVWVSVRTTQELVLGQLGFGSSLDVRIDAVAFVFGLLITAPAAILLRLQKRTWQEAALSTLMVAAALGAIEAGDIVLTAIAGGTAATLAVVLLETEDPAAHRPSWAILLAAWLALAWVGVILQVRGGTAVYSAVPVSAVTPAVFALIAAAALLASGLFPWRTWPTQLWSRPKFSAAGVTVSALFPLGLYLLVRAYELGDGRYPHVAFNALLGVAGLAVALASALRAQAAADRRGFLAHVVPGFGGFALMSIAMGTPLGLVAGLTTLVTAAVLIACISLLPEGANLGFLVTIAAAVGLPPGLAFGSRVLGIESTFEAGDFFGLIGVAGAVTWAVWMVGAARAIGLPKAAAEAGNQAVALFATGFALLTIAAGPALATIQVGLANPVVAEVMPAGVGALGGRLSTVVTTSTVLPVLTLFLPLLLIAVLGYALAGAQRLRSGSRPAVLSTPSSQTWTRLAETARAARVPEQYRSLIDVAGLEAAAVSGRPLLWLGALVALAFAVTR